MALYKCPSCGREISDKAPACIHCGYTVSQAPSSSLVCCECGKELSDTDSVCKNCGCPISEALNERERQFAGIAVQNKQTYKPNGHKNAKPPVIAIIFAFILVILVAIIFLLGKKDTHIPDETSVAQPVTTELIEATEVSYTMPIENTERAEATQALPLPSEPPLNETISEETEPEDLGPTSDPKDFAYNVGADEQLIITGYFGDDSSVIIPTKIDGYPVTTIGEKAFYNSEKVKSVTIPKSVKYIAENAFSWSRLESAVINCSGSIGKHAFYNCEKLKEVTISEGVTSIGENAFESCKVLKTITIPKSVKFISENAFSWTGLQSVTINCNGLIGNKAFYNCEKLKEVTLSEGVTSIGENAFESCDILKNIIIPESVKFIGKDAFSWTGLESATINSNGSIGIKAFYNCESLKEVTLSEGVTSIGESAFESCDLLKSITIPTSVKYICKDAFSWSGLETVTLNGCSAIGKNAFYNCESLKEVTMVEGITYIGENAFYSCDELRSVTIPESVSFIGEDAFEYCPKLKYVSKNANTNNKGNDTCTVDGHPKGQWRLTKEATLTTVGIEEQFCAVCDKSLSSRETGKKDAAVNWESFNFEDKECLEWLNDLSTATFGYAELGLYGNGTDNTSYSVQMSNGETGILIFKHDKYDDICAIMIYFENWEDASALAVWIAGKIDEQFNSDNALAAIAANQDYTDADMTVARINLSKDMEVAVLATEDYFTNISG